MSEKDKQTDKYMLLKFLREILIGNRISKINYTNNTISLVTENNYEVLINTYMTAVKVFDTMICYCVNVDEEFTRGRKFSDKDSLVFHNDEIDNTLYNNKELNNIITRIKKGE